MTAINSDSANPAYYKWIDGDGTQHFFIRTEESEQGDSVWRCEDIPDYGLTVSAEGTIKIFDKENTCMIFDQNTGYLTTIYDSQEDELSYRTNMIIITRNGEQITKVRDAAGKEITLSYSSNKLSSITDNRGRTLSYEYTNNNLTKITYPDCKVASYQYDSQNRLEKVIGIDGYSIEYTYIGDKVTEIVEKDGRGNVGRSVSFVYNAKSTRIYDNQNNWAEYVFNDQGIVTSMFDSEGFAANSEYDIEANSRSKFKVLSASNAKKSIINLSKYSNAESSMYWSLNRSNSSDNIETCSTNAYMGNKSIRLKKQSSNRNDYIRVSQSITLEKDKHYTASMYVYGEDTFAPGTEGNDLTMFANINGMIVRGNRLIEKGKWNRISVTFSTENLTSTTQNCNIGAELIGDPANVLVDCLQIEEGAGVNDYNMLDNSDFTYVDLYDTTKSQFWDGDGSRTTISSANQINECDINAMQISGSYTADKTLSQTVQVSGSAEDYFYVGGYLKGNTTRNATIELQFTKSKTYNSETQDYDREIEVGAETIEFENNVSSWQHGSQTVLAPCDFVEVTVIVHSNYSSKPFKVDGLYLISGKNTVDITYDVNGNVESETDERNVTTSYTNTESNDVEQVSQNGNITRFIYDDKHNNTSTTDVDNVVSSSKYDDFGNETESLTQTENADNGDYIKAESVYSTAAPGETGFANNAGNYLVKEYDERGKAISYDYDYESGLLMGVTDAKGNSSKYTYDTDTDAVTKVELESNSNLKNEYQYSNDGLTGISSSTVSYSFVYDGFGNQTKTNVGNVTLAENTINVSTGNLTKVDYGNGDYVEYQYDNAGRIKTTKWNGAAKFKYYYNANGNLARLEDLENDASYSYQYDFSGRLLRTEDSKGNAFWTTYDDHSSTPKTEGYSYYADSKETFVNASTQNESGNLKLSEVKLPNGQIYTEEFAYDSLSRVSKSTLGTKENDSSTPVEKYEAEYSYLDVGGRRTTNIVDSIQFRQGSNNKDNI